MQPGAPHMEVVKDNDRALPSWRLSQACDAWWLLCPPCHLLPVRGGGESLPLIHSAACKLDTMEKMTALEVHVNFHQDIYLGHVLFGRGSLIGLLEYASMYGTLQHKPGGCIDYLALPPSCPHMPLLLYSHPPTCPHTPPCCPLVLR